MPKGTDILTKKLGPLPLWLWIAVGAVGYYYVKKRNQPSTAASTGTAPPSPSYYGASAPLIAYGDQYTGSQGGSIGTSTSGGTAAPPTGTGVTTQPVQTPVNSPGGSSGPVATSPTPVTQPTGAATQLKYNPSQPGGVLGQIYPAVGPGVSGTITTPVGAVLEYHTGTLNGSPYTCIGPASAC